MKHKEEFDVGKTLKTYRPPPRVESDDKQKTQALLEPSKKKYTPKRLLAGVLLVILVAFIFIGIWDSININRALSTTFGSGNVLSLLSPTKTQSQNGRTNILMVGYSVDDPGHPGASLTDSILLLSLSDQRHRGYMLSIPRDLYVSIPGYGYGKINEAYKDGGMSLLTRIISDDFGTPVNYTALFNYGAVRGVVNAVGGITVDIHSSDPRGLYDPNISPADGGPLKLTNGVQKLDGQTALNLTRARGDAYNSYGFPQADFDRTAHQRQVILAIKQKLDWKLILNPLENKRVFKAVGQNVQTNIDVNELRPLFSLVNSANAQDLKSYSLRDLDGTNYLASYDSYTSGSALIPTAGVNDYSQIQAALATLNTKN